MAPKNQRRPRKKFLDVDVFRSKFGPIAEKAVYDVYQTEFNIPTHEMRKYSFQRCVKELRELRISQGRVPNNWNPETNMIED